MMRLRLSLALFALIAAFACATNPATGKRQFNLMSEAQEISAGQEADAQVKKEMGLYSDGNLQEYISSIGMKLAQASERPNLPWHYSVVDVPAVNAFALPGGYIYITRGILPFLNDEAQLAGVLGHETGHVTARHAAQQYTRAVGGTVGLVALGIFVPGARPFGQLAEQGLGVLFLKYGRGDELQADQLGARYAALGNWDPAAVPDMLTTLGRLDEASGQRRGVPNWLETHPEPLARVKEIQPTVQQLSAGRTDFVRNRDAMLRAVDGIIYGDNPDQGVVRGASFLHPPLRFRIDFPNGWDIQNAPEQVMAKAPGAEVYMLLEQVPMPRGNGVDNIARAQMENAGFRVVSGSRDRVNGLDAYIGLYQGSLEGLGNVRMRAAHIVHNGNIYLVAGFAAPAIFDPLDSAMLMSIRSFKPLTADEAAAVHPNRIDIYVVRPGDSWQSIAERSGGVIKPTTLAVMNGAEPNSQPMVGSRIKIVVGG
ncbi:MAG TPA: M48 family metalloprotease [Vicinamibacterales bacterium]|nr:M48 family metalloprotease [Vicinamibacterales bacterium]